MKILRLKLQAAVIRPKTGLNIQASLAIPYLDQE